MDDDIPGLKIERMEDGTGEGLIILEQDDGSGNIGNIAIHPIHLRYMAEKFGLVGASDPGALKTIAALTRRLRVLYDRIAHLDDWLWNHSDTQHANLDYEQTYSSATMTLAAEFCAELDDVPVAAAPPPPVPETQPATAPATPETLQPALI